MSKFLSYLTSLALIGAIYSTSIIESGTYSTLVLTVVWVLILLGVLAAAIFGIALFMMSAVKYEMPEEIVAKWKVVDKPNLWISIPLMLGWLSALTYVEWTVTAVVYLLETIILLTVSYLMYAKLDELTNPDADDMIKYVKDPVVREELYKAREEKRKS